MPDGLDSPPTGDCHATIFLSEYASMRLLEEYDGTKAEFIHEGNDATGEERVCLGMWISPVNDPAHLARVECPTCKKDLPVRDVDHRAPAVDRKVTHYSATDLGLPEGTIFVIPTRKPEWSLTEFLLRIRTIRPGEQSETALGDLELLEPSGPIEFYRGDGSDLDPGPFQDEHGNMTELARDLMSGAHCTCGATDGSIKFVTEQVERCRRCMRVNRPSTVTLTYKELETHLAQAHADGYESRDRAAGYEGGAEVDESSRQYASGYLPTLLP